MKDLHRPVSILSNEKREVQLTLEAGHGGVLSGIPYGIYSTEANKCISTICLLGVIKPTVCPSDDFIIANSLATTESIQDCQDVVPHQLPYDG